MKEKMVKAICFKGSFLQAGATGGYVNEDNHDKLYFIRDRATLEKIAPTFKGVPLFVEHPQSEGNEESEVIDEAVGYVSKVWYNQEDAWLWCDFVIYDEEAAHLLEGQNWKLSCTYEPIYGSGITKHNGVVFDNEIIDGIGTSIAIVQNPRYKDVEVLTNADSIKKVIDNYPEPSERLKNTDMLGIKKKIKNSEEKSEIKKDPKLENSEVEGEMTKEELMEMIKEAVSAAMNGKADIEEAEETDDTIENSEDAEEIQADKKYKIGEKLMNGEELMNCYGSSLRNSEDDEKAKKEEELKAKASKLTNSDTSSIQARAARNQAILDNIKGEQGEQNTRLNEIFIDSRAMAKKMGI